MSDVGGCLVIIRSFPKGMDSWVVCEPIALLMLVVAGLGWSGLKVTQFVHLVRKKQGNVLVPFGFILFFYWINHS